MRSKVIVIGLLAALAAFSSAQGRVDVALPNSGEHEVWIDSALGSAPPSTSTRTKGLQVSVETAGKTDKDLVFVWDKQGGNVASKPLGLVRKAGTWRVDAADFKDIGQVAVSVESVGQPVAAAEVRLKDARRETSQLLDPTSKGKATFFGVKPGKLEITVNYRQGETMGKPVTQVFEAPLKREEAVPSLTISLPKGVGTLGADAAGTASDEEKPAEGAAPTAGETEKPKAATKEPAVPGTEPANPIGSFVVILLGLGLAGGMAYFALKYAKQNPELVQGKLEQLGVQVPKPGDDAGAIDPNAGPAPAPMPAKPAPPQKILLDDAAPDLVAIPAPPVAAAMVAVTDPRLLDDGGNAMPVSEGETVVGREIGLGLSLVGESTVSRSHAAIVRTGGTVVVRDLGSTNGTFVNGSPVSGDTPLNPGDQVQFGAVRFRFEG